MSKIKWFWPDWLGFRLPRGVTGHKHRPALDGRRPEKFKMDFYHPGVQGVHASTSQGQFRSQRPDILSHFGRDVKSDFPKSVFHRRRFYGLIDACEMRILALDHGSKRIGVAVSDETKTIAQPLEYIPAEPFADFLARLKQLLVEKEISLVLIGLPRNMDGSHGPAAQKVDAFAGVLKTAITVPVKMWDERLTSTMANRILIQGGVRRDKRKEKVDKMAAAILLQSYLDGM
jgi:putative Holliday junction resolvase